MAPFLTAPEVGEGAAAPCEEAARRTDEAAAREDEDAAATEEEERRRESSSSSSSSSLPCPGWRVEVAEGLDEVLVREAVEDLMQSSSSSSSPVPTEQLRVRVLVLVELDKTDEAVGRAADPEKEEDDPPAPGAATRRQRSSKSEKGLSISYCCELVLSCRRLTVYVVVEASLARIHRTGSFNGAGAASEDSNVGRKSSTGLMRQSC